MRRPAAALTVCLLLAACNGESNDPSVDAAKTPAAPDVACLTVGADKLAAIADGAESDVGALALTRGAAVLSPNHSKVYLIAARFTAPGVPEQTGVWASNDLGLSGLTMAVDGYAKQFTVWPDADKTQAQISTTDASVEDARSCL